MGRFYHFYFADQFPLFLPSTEGHGKQLFVSTLILTKGSLHIASDNHYEWAAVESVWPTNESIPRSSVCLSVCLPDTLSPSLDRPLSGYTYACCRLCFTSPRKPNFSCRGQRFLLKVWTSALLALHPPRPSQGRLVEQGGVCLDSGPECNVTGERRAKIYEHATHHFGITNIIIFVINILPSMVTTAVFPTTTFIQYFT